MVREIVPGPPRVAGDRRLERVQAVVLLFVAQLLQETHAQMPAVELAVPVEEMNLEERLRHRVHRGAASEACHATAEALHFNREYSRQRRRPAQRDIGSRKSETAPELRAVGNPAADGIRMAEQPLGCA